MPSLEIQMRLSANHRKHRQLTEEIPNARFIISKGRNWYFMVPPDRVQDARRIGLTVVRERTP